ncbi:outer membrane protein assembly factor BamB family protein [Streptomyces sp. CMB-StM0423]|uniref:outer membrane protein assembly factor BamB family protein n=1 Tax=Streptomyces sp. CMB-StM0423 TaxID=2059884 RepID=UPI003FA36042
MAAPLGLRRRRGVRHRRRHRLPRRSAGGRDPARPRPRPRLGAERWTYGEEFGIVHAVAAAGGLTYVGAGGVVALDSRSGDERWSDGTTAFSFTTGAGFVVADDGEEVHVLDAAGGGKRWSLPAENSTAVLAADGLVFVCDAYLRLAVLAAADKAVAWERELEYPSTVHAAGDGMLYLTEDRLLHAWRADTGDSVWRLPDAEFAGLAGGAVHVWGSVAEDGTTGGRPRLYALDPSDGDVLWTYGGAEYVHAVTAGPAGLVFAGLPDGYVHALRPPTARRPNGGTSGAP